MNRKEKLTPELIKIFEAENYTCLVETKTKGVCGILRFAFTTGVVIDMDRYQYRGRYCYKSKADALLGLAELIDKPEILHPTDSNWIKYKGGIDGVYYDIGNPNNNINENE